MLKSTDFGGPAQAAVSIRGGHTSARLHEGLRFFYSFEEEAIVIWVVPGANGAGAALVDMTTVASHSIETDPENNSQGGFIWYSITPDQEALLFADAEPNFGNDLDTYTYDYGNGPREYTFRNWIVYQLPNGYVPAWY